jgi:hypothetical protein
MIDDLLDLDDIPSSINNGGSEYARKISQENHDRESMTKGPIKNKVRNNVDFRQAVNGGVPEMRFSQGGSENYNFGPRAMPQNNHHEQKIDYIESYTPPAFTCIDVSNHISSCPICSKIYNDDKTPYLIAIAILVIILIIMLKKIIEKPSGNY